MIKEDAKILSNKEIGKDVFEMLLETKISKDIKPGQFINIQIKEHFLRRPISVASIEGENIRIIYKVFGTGTRELSNYKEDERVNIIGPLGRGFEIDENLKEVLLVAGGVGLPPLYELCKEYRKRNIKVVFVAGFKSKEDIFYEEEIKKLTDYLYISTDDGSYGYRGNVIDLIKDKGIDIDFVYGVGPNPMLKGLQENYTKGYISLEERMACGIGACMGCVCSSKEHENGYRVCKDGPVFKIGEIVL